MIQAKDLRIGNIVEFNAKIEVISGIYKKTVRFEGWNSNVDIKRINPIQLNPEILEKCGAKKVQYKKNTVVYLLGELLFRLVDNTCLLCIETIDDYNSSLYTITEPLNYLHELQNLVFALTKNELEVSL